MLQERKDLRSFINISMGGFHAAPSFLSMTGSKDDGLKELKMQLRLLLSFLSELETSDRCLHLNVAEVISRKNLMYLKDGFMKTTNTFLDFGTATSCHCIVKEIKKNQTK